MSIIDAYDPNPNAILQPGCAEPVTECIMPETVLVTFRKAVTEMVCERFAPEVVGAAQLGRTIQMYRFNYHGRPLGFYNTIVGSAPNAALLEQAIAMGGRRFVIFGSCGALHSEIPAGQFILPTRAWRDEGVSYHYAPPSDWMEVPTAGRLGDIFAELEIPYAAGPVWTTDALYRETLRNTRRRREDGCLAVEMECAALMAVAQFRGVEVYQFLYATDCLDGDAWDRRIMGSKKMEFREQCLDIALRVAERL